MLPKPPELSPRSPTWRYLGPSWSQLAANLAHLASILGPSSPQLRQKSPPDRAKNLKKGPQRPQNHPGGRQRAPGQPLGLEFSWFGGPFRTSFFIFSCSLSFNSSGGLESGLLQTCDDSSLILKPSHPPRNPPILHGLPASSSRHVAAWRAQRIGYPPPPGGVSGVCKSRCPACPISNFQLYLMVPGGPPRALKCPRQPASLAYLVHFFDLSWPS